MAHHVSTYVLYGIDYTIYYLYTVPQEQTSATRGVQSLLLLHIITVVIHGCMMCSYIKVYAEQQMQSSTTDASSCNLTAVASVAIIHNTKGYYIIVEQGIASLNLMQGTHFLYWDAGSFINSFIHAFINRMLFEMCLA